MFFIDGRHPKHGLDALDTLSLWISLKDYFVPTCDKLLICTCNFIFMYMSSVHSYLHCVLEELVFKVYSHGE